MNIDALLAQARQMHAGLLTDVGSIDRQGPPTIDPDTGEEIPTWQPVAPEPIPMLVQHVTRLATGASTSAGEHILVVDYVSKMGLDVGVQGGDRITVTASHDSRNVGQWYVSEVERQGLAITRRVHLEATWHSPSTPRS